MPKLSKADRAAKVSQNEARRRKELALVEIREMEAKGVSVVTVRLARFTLRRATGRVAAGGESGAYCPFCTIVATT